MTRTKKKKINLRCLRNNFQIFLLLFCFGFFGGCRGCFRAALLANTDYYFKLFINPCTLCKVRGPAEEKQHQSMMLASLCFSVAYVILFSFVFTPNMTYSIMTEKIKTFNFTHITFAGYFYILSQKESTQIN